MWNGFIFNPLSLSFHGKPRRHLKNVGSTEEWIHESRTQLLRTICPRSFTHFPWGFSCFGVFVFAAICQFQQKKGLGHSTPCHNSSPGDITTQEPYCHPPVPHLPHITLDSLLVWLSRNPCWAHLLSHRKPIDMAKSSSAYLSVPSPHIMPQMTRNQLGSQNGKSIQSRRKLIIMTQKTSWPAGNIIHVPNGYLKPWIVLNPT